MVPSVELTVLGLVLDMIGSIVLVLGSLRAGVKAGRGTGLQMSLGKGFSIPLSRRRDGKARRIHVGSSTIGLLLLLFGFGLQLLGYVG